ncbi:hypothetical protein [Lysobacter sp. FW306-1B-D06B]|uniref:hypothetical protein n=1 Tax=Lysobacter sp. FW306-1B-D06B TaxID=3140250 RepID=UPI003140432F
MEPENPRPGQEVTLIALLEAPVGSFSVSCLTADKNYDPWNPKHTETGGTVSIFSGQNLIGSRQITPSNTGPQQQKAQVDSGGVRFYYYGFNTSTYSLKYTLPSSPGNYTFSATFSGDNYFAKGSSSPALTVQSRVRDITPALMLLLN